MIEHYFKFAQNVVYYREKAKRSRHPYESMEAYVKDQQWYWKRAITNEQYIIDYAVRLIERLEREAKRLPTCCPSTIPFYHDLQCNATLDNTLDGAIIAPQ